MAAISGLCVGAAWAESAATPSGPGSLTGVWSPADFDRSVFRSEERNQILTIEGEAPPLQKWAVDLIEKRRQDAKAGRPYAGLQAKCLPAGMPQMMFGSGLPHQTLENPDHVVILVEELSFFRIIRLNAKHPDDPDPTLMGDSIGHWENGDLVVDTIAISERTLLPGGIPHTDQLRITERFRRTSKDRVELLMTFDDPKTFTKSWTVANHLQFDGRQISEYYCENNRNVGEGDVTTVIHPGGN
jgi:hypothetical protein